MKKSLAFIGLLVLGLVVVGCGKESTTTTASGTSGGADGVATIHITGNDQMKYDRTAFTVQPGQKVKLTLKNVGKMPIAAMGHNLVVLKKGEDYKEFATEAAKGSLENNYLPEAMMSKVIAHTRVLGPGEEQTIEFTAPTETGNYTYVCTFPGHFALMHGIMTVK